VRREKKAVMERYRKEASYTINVKKHVAQIAEAELAGGGPEQLSEIE
jgi:hypothetical protein